MTGACTVKVHSGKKPAAPTPTPPPAATAEPVKPRPKIRALRLFTVKNNKVELPGPIQFETGTAKLRPESDAVLEIVADYLTQTVQVTKHRVEGHTDTDGADAANQTLSELRAMAVAQWLIAKGIDCKRLIAVGFGESKLKVSPEVTPVDKEFNRRVDFVNAELDGKPIGGLPVDGGGKIAGNTCAGR
ncbi:MAG: OmpA family protein [Myxococcales bacterium]|nr:OmpA family protein [Myxococcales bacterium]